MTGKLRFICRSIKEDGLRAVYDKALRAVRLKLQILARGKNRIVLLDGCRFPLSKLPDTSMKLELLNGNYEMPERNAARQYIRPDWPVIELGACIGVVACITNKMLLDPVSHIVLEANPMVIPHLESNRQVNQCSFKIINAALAYDEETVTFSPWRDFWGNSLQVKGGQPPVTVAATQLGNIVSEEKFDKFALICDIEGQEYQLISREAELLRKAELIIMEVHPHIIGEEKVRELLVRLEDLGFSILNRAALVIVFGKS